MRLETRRVLSVNGTFVAGTLTVDITEGGVETANLLPELDASNNPTGNFFLDENGNSLWDGASEVRDAFTNLRQVIVNGFNTAGLNVPGGTFNWFGDFSNAPLDLPVPSVIDINNVANVSFDASSKIVAGGSVNIDATNVTLGGDLDVANGINIAAGRFDQVSGATLTAVNDIDLEVDATAKIDGQMRSMSGSIAIESLGAGITMDTTGELIAEVGSVKMRASAAGADIVADSIFAGRDILVSAAYDVTLNAAVTSDTGANAALFDGHTHINAGNTITSSAVVSSLDGSVLIRGTNVNLLDGGDLNANLGLYIDADGTISIASIINGQQDVLIRNGTVDLVATGSVFGSRIGIYSNSLSIDGTLSAVNGIAISSESTINMTENGLINGTSVVMTADGSIALGRIVATEAILSSSTGSISDNNGAAINVQSNRLLLIARQGSIGSSNLPGTPDSNPNAIDVRVDTLSAISGNNIYIHQTTDNLTIGRVDAVVAGVNPLFFTVPFNGSAAQGFGNLSISLGGASDLTASGPIKIKVDAGTLTITDGNDADGNGVTSSLGDILLWGENGLVVQSFVVATNGDITFRSNGTVDINSSGSLQAGDTGLILSNSLTGTGTISANNGLAIQTVADLAAGGMVSSDNGSIALISTAGSVNQNANLLAGVDFYSNAAADYNMEAAARIDASGNAIIRAASNLNLSLIQANQVALIAASIIDANADESVNVVANNSILNATHTIGTNNPNPNFDSNLLAIDLDVDTISTRSGIGGTYLRQIAAGGDIFIGFVDPITTTIATKEVKFNSGNPSFNLTTQPTTVAAQENAESAGVFKLVTENGLLKVSDRNDSDGLGVSAASDILLESRNQATTGGDIVINAIVRSGLGHVTLYAADDVLVNAAVSTAGAGTLYIEARNNATDAIGPRVDGVNLDAALTTVNGDILIASAQNIRSTALISSDRGDIGLIAFRDVIQTATGNIAAASGDVLIEANNGNWTMEFDTSINVGGGNFYGHANGDISLGQILVSNAVQNRIALQSIAGSIVDINAAGINIAETVAGSNTTVSLRASQRVGNSGGGSDASDLAIDLNVDTVAAVAGSGIYLREIGDGFALEIDAVSEVNVTIDGVRRSRFDSSITDASQTRTLASLEDLTTTSDGSINVIIENGTLTINGGINESGILTHGSGNIFLTVQNQISTGADIVINADIRSGTGDITLDAADDIHTAAEISNTASGDISFIARGNQMDATLVRNDGISLGGSVTTRNGNISIVSQRDIDTTNENVVVSGVGLTVNSGGYTHLNNTMVSLLTANVGGVGNLDSTFEMTNRNASNRGDDFFLDMNPRNATNGDLLPNQSEITFQSNSSAASVNYRFQSRTEENYALFIKNHEALAVASIVATSSVAPHVYVETVGTNNLTVDGTIATNNTQVNNTGGGTEGLIILVAGGEFELANTGNLVTTANFAGGVRTQIVNQIGPDGDTVMITGYHGGQGAATFPQPVSTRIVNPDIFGSNAADTDPEIDAFQRVVLNFGAPGELGFDIHIAYADGVLQRFHRASDLGVVDDTTFNLSSRVLNLDSYASSPLGTPVSAFTRTSLMSQPFIIDNTLLPTVVTVRRADDFFIFENASSTDISQVRDLTVETGEILDVVSITAETRALPLPADVPLIIPQILLVGFASEGFVNVVLPSSSLELTEIVDRQTELSIYQVYFEDRDSDGYADEDELPKDSEVLDFFVIDGDKAKEKKYLEPKTRVKQGTIVAGFGSVTNQEIEAIKADFLKNPNQPTGAYAIIKKDTLGNETVLELFTVQDGQDESPDRTDETPMLKRKHNLWYMEQVPNESILSKPAIEGEIPPQNNQSQLDLLSQMNGSSGPAYSDGYKLLAATLLLSRVRQRETQQVDITDSCRVNSLDRIDRSARRARRILASINHTNLNR